MASLSNSFRQGNGWSGGDSSHGTYDSGGNLAHRVGGKTYVTAITTASLKNGWHRLALTVSGGNTALYVDGSNVHSGSDAGTAAAKMPWHLMSNGTTGQRTRGLADEVAFYDNALSASTIAEHYQAGRR